LTTRPSFGRLALFLALCPSFPPDSAHSLPLSFSSGPHYLKALPNPPKVPHYRSIRLFSLINSLSSRHPTLRITHRHIQAQHPNPKQCQLSETPKPEPQPHPLAQALNSPPAGAKIRRPCCSIMFSGSARKSGGLLYLVRLEKK
jgi:hypothetical protein